MYLKRTTRLYIRRLGLYYFEMALLFTGVFFVATMGMGLLACVIMLFCTVFGRV